MTNGKALEDSICANQVGLQAFAGSLAVLATPILISRVRNEKNHLSQIRLDGVSACTVLRPEYKTHKQKDANSFVFVIKNKRRLEF